MPGIKVKLVRSRAGRSKDQLATLAGMGLYRLNQQRVLPDNPETVGMCQKLQHMVVWERVEQEPVKRARRAHKPTEQQPAE